MIWKDKDGFLKKIKDKDRFGVFLDMGKGKTALLLALIDQKIFEGVKKILIIAPKKVTLATWQKEIRKFKNFNYLESVLTLIDGTPKKRLDMFEKAKNQDYFVHIISSDLVDWLVYKERAKVEYKTKQGEIKHRYKQVINEHTPEYDLIIVDECSQFKDVTRKRFQALELLAKNKLFLLSGTPFPNVRKDKYEFKSGRIIHNYLDADEMYYAFKLLRLYNDSIYAFRREYCYSFQWEKYKLRMAPDIYDALQELLATKSIKAKLELDIEKSEYILYCDIDKELLKKMKRDYYIETNELQEVTASNRAIMINKTLQLSNGFLYDDMDNTVRFNTNKFDLLKKLLAKIKSENVIIYYNFAEDKRYLLENLAGAREYLTKQDEDDWNAGKIKYFVLSPFAEKFGLNLQDGGNTIIWFGLVWSGESVVQSNRRIFRTGQKNDVNIYYLLARDGFDKYVFDVVVSKTKTMEEFKTNWLGL